MAIVEKDLGLVVGTVGPKGDRGEDAYIESVTVTSDSTHTEPPKAEVVMGGEPGAQTVEISFTGLQGAPGRDAELNEVTASIDGTYGEPQSVDVSWTGDSSAKDLSLAFHNLQGEPGRGLSILDTYDSLEKLQAAHEENEVGDGYIAGTHYYIWNGSEFKDCGELKGEKGDEGPAGKDAGFGTLSVALDEDDGGEPSVDASWDGEDTSKNLSLTFKNIKGDIGPVGPAAGFGSITTEYGEDDTGSPVIEASWSGEDTSKDLSLTFKNLRGEQGFGIKDSLIVEGYEETRESLLEKVSLHDEITLEGSVDCEVGDIFLANVSLTDENGAEGVLFIRYESYDEESLSTTGNILAVTLPPKLDSIKLNGSSSDIVLGDGTVKSISEFITENIETIRDELGLATTEHIGFIPSLPKQE